MADNSSKSNNDFVNVTIMNSGISKTVRIPAPVPNSYAKIRVTAPVPYPLVRSPAPCPSVPPPVVNAGTIPSASLMQVGSKTVPVICIQQSQLQDRSKLNDVIKSVLSSSNQTSNMPDINLGINNQNVGKVCSQFLKPRITFSHPVLTGGKPCNAVLQPTAMMIGKSSNGKCIVTYKVMKTGVSPVNSLGGITQQGQDCISLLSVADGATQNRSLNNVIINQCGIANTSCNSAQMNDSLSTLTRQILADVLQNGFKPNSARSANISSSNTSNPIVIDDDEEQSSRTNDVDSSDVSIIECLSNVVNKTASQIPSVVSSLEKENDVDEELLLTCETVNEVAESAVEETEYFSEDDNVPEESETDSASESAMNPSTSDTFINDDKKQPHLMELDLPADNNFEEFPKNVEDSVVVKEDPLLLDNNGAENYQIYVNNFNDRLEQIDVNLQPRIIATETKAEVIPKKLKPVSNIQESSSLIDRICSGNCPIYLDNASEQFDQINLNELPEITATDAEVNMVSKKVTKIRTKTTAPDTNLNTTVKSSTSGRLYRKSNTGIDMQSCYVSLERILLSKSSINLSTTSDRLLCCVNNEVQNKRCAVNSDATPSSLRDTNSRTKRSNTVSREISPKRNKTTTKNTNNKASNSQVDESLYALKFVSKLKKTIAPSAVNNLSKSGSTTMETDAAGANSSRFKLLRLTGSNNLYLVPCNETTKASSDIKSENDTSAVEEPMLGVSADDTEQEAVIGEAVTVKNEPQDDEMPELSYFPSTSDDNSNISFKRELSYDSDAESHNTSPMRSPGKRRRQNINESVVAKRTGASRSARSPVKAVPVLSPVRKSIITTRTGARLGRSSLTAHSAETSDIAVSSVVSSVEKLTKSADISRRGRSSLAAHSAETSDTVVSPVVSSVEKSTKRGRGRPTNASREASTSDAAENNKKSITSSRTGENDSRGSCRKERGNIFECMSVTDLSSVNDDASSRGSSPEKIGSATTMSTGSTREARDGTFSSQTVPTVVAPHREKINRLKAMLQEQEKQLESLRKGQLE